LTALRALRRVLVGVAGLSVVAVGVAMIVLPGPAFVVIPAGFAILAAEFAWARRLMNKAKRRLADATERFRPTQAGGTAITETGASLATRRATLPRNSLSSP
jgi:tellurite resistance protein TerC